MSEPSELTRDELLAQIKSRMELNDIFYADIWKRVLKSSTFVLREICDSDFEVQVLKMKGTK
jgi:hypothetical protein